MHKRRFSMFALYMLMLSLCAFGVHAQTAPADQNPDWFSKPYAYVLVDQDVRSAMEEFGHNLGLIVVMSDKVRGKSRSSVRGVQAGDFLTQLCDTNGLSWYYDGNILYLSSDAETGTRLFKTQNENERLQDYLAGLNVYGKQISTRLGPDGDELFVSGPPAYLSMVQQHVDHQQRTVAAPVTRERGIRVFRGGTVSEVSN